MTWNVAVVKRWVELASVEEIAEAINIQSPVGTALCMAAALKKDHESGISWAFDFIFFNYIFFLFLFFCFFLPFMGSNSFLNIIYMVNLYCSWHLPFQLMRSFRG